jgi:hypothetical protein
MSRARFWISFVVMFLVTIVAVAVAAYQWGRADRNAVRENPPAPDPAAVKDSATGKPGLAEVKGWLQPVQVAKVYAPTEGQVKDVKVRPGDQIPPKYTAVLLYSVELEKQQMTLTNELNQATATQRSAQLRLNDPSLKSDEKFRHQADQFQAEQMIASRQAMLRDLADRYQILPNQPGWFQAKAPEFNPELARPGGPPVWTVLAYEGREVLGRTVRPNEALVHLAHLEGPWEIELAIPAEDLSAVLRAMRALAEPGAAKEGPVGPSLNVDVFLAGQPDTAYLARLDRVSPHGIPGPIDAAGKGATVYTAFARLDGDDVPAGRRLLREQRLVGREVRCVIRTDAPAAGK